MSSSASKYIDKSETCPLFIGIGSHSCQLGMLGSGKPPRAIFPSVFHFNKKKQPVVIGAPSTPTISVGDEAVKKSKEDDTPLVPLFIENGVNNDFQLHIEQLLHHCFYNELRVAPEDHIIVLVLPVTLAKKHRDLIVKTLFDQFKVSAVRIHVQEQAALQWMSSTPSTPSVVINVGHFNTTIVPVYADSVISHGIQVVPFGCAHIAAVMLHHICAQNQNVQPNASLAKSLLQKFAFVVESAANLQSTASSFEKQNIESTHQKFSAASELFLAPELLFQPKHGIPDGVSSLVDVMSGATLTLSQEAPNLIDLIKKAIAQCDKEIHQQLYQNIFIVGGGSQLRGLTKRIQADLGKEAVVNTQPGAVWAGWFGQSTPWQPKSPQQHPALLENSFLSLEDYQNKDTDQAKSILLDTLF